jgi:hypothetical protein
MKARVVVPFIDGRLPGPTPGESIPRQFNPGDEVTVKPGGESFLLGAGYGVPIDDEARVYWKKIHGTDYTDKPAA